MFCAWMCLFKSSIATCSSRWLFDIFHCLFIILFGFNSYNKTLAFLVNWQVFIFHAVVLLVAWSDTRSGTHWACIDWFRYLGDSFVQNYAWSFQYGFWGISHHLNALFSPEFMALISSNLAMAFPSLIRNLISGSISEQLVENYSKRFKTHFINGPVYPYSWAIFIISEWMWRNPFRNRCGFSRF